MASIRHIVAAVAGASTVTTPAFSTNASCGVLAGSGHPIRHHHIRFSRRIRDSGGVNSRPRSALFVCTFFRRSLGSRSSREGDIQPMT